VLESAIARCQRGVHARIPGPAGTQLPNGAVSGERISSVSPLGVDSSALSYGDFKRAVLRGEERWAIDSKGRKFIATLKQGELEALEPSCSPKAKGALMKLRPAAARACRALLKDVRAELAAAQAAGDAQAQRVTLIGIHSAYRTNAEETSIWNDNYPGYYLDTRADRERLPGGPHGKRAVAYLVVYIANRKAAPGYSNHSDGTAVDFGTREGSDYLSRIRRRRIEQRGDAPGFTVGSLPLSRHEASCERPRMAFIR